MTTTTPTNMTPRLTTPRQRLAAIATDIKLHHSVFAMPFALLGAFMAWPVTETWKVFAAQLALVVVCMVSARTVAMIANRLIDRNIDALNPRTRSRALPSRRVAVRDAMSILLMAALIFIGACVTFGFAFDNWWPTLLSLPVLLWISAYGCLKRFTCACHLYLGSSLAVSPVAAALAVDPAALTTQWPLWLISLNVLCWVAGFDIIYALQDLEVDRIQLLHSMPSRLGVARSLWISRGLHAGSMVCLIIAAIIDPRLGNAFAIGIASAVLLLIIEHAATAGGATGRIQLAFFTLNGIISLALGSVGIVEIVIHRAG